jgi:hypothetical protein
MAVSGFAIVDQFCRAGELQPHFYRRCQREMRDDVLPLLAWVDAHGGPDAVRATVERTEELEAENRQLRAQLERSGKLKAKTQEPADVSA